MRNNFQTIQLGRGIAAVMVVFHHLSSTYFGKPLFFHENAFHGVFSFGYVGVYYFFVLSGFIILAAHKKDIGVSANLRNYAWRRFIRIYPVYWIVLFSVLMIYWCFSGPTNSKITSVYVILNSIVLIGPNNFSSLAVAWTLFHEILFYAVFAILIFDKKIGLSVLILWLFLCLLSRNFNYSHSYFVSPVNVLFGAGMLSYIITEKINIRRPIILGIAGASAFVVLGLIEVNTHFSDLYAYGFAAALAITGFACAERVKPIDIPVYFKVIGDASFSIYLVHFPILAFLARIMRKPLNSVPAELAFFIIAGLAIVGGMIFYFIVEKPMMVRLKNASFLNFFPTFTKERAR